MRRQFQHGVARRWWAAGLLALTGCGGETGLQPDSVRVGAPSAEEPPPRELFARPRLLSPALTRRVGARRDYPASSDIAMSGVSNGAASDVDVVERLPSPHFVLQVPSAAFDSAQTGAPERDAAARSGPGSSGLRSGATGREPQPDAGKSTLDLGAPARLPAVTQPIAAQPSSAMTAVRIKADEIVRHGFDLANRGAVYSARTEFTAALYLVAQAHDTEQGVDDAMVALSAGLTALQEAQDFVLRMENFDDQLHVALKVAAHRTTVLKDRTEDGITPAAAANRYYTYAQERLALAADDEPVAAMALYGLGKAIMCTAKNGSSDALAAAGQGMACYQAALQADPRNYRAAHELGVLLANNGMLDLSKQAFLQAIKTRPTAASWRNLAVVHQRLGERDLSAASLRNAAALGGATGAPDRPHVQWLDAQSFALSAPQGAAAADKAPADHKSPAKTAARPSPARQAQRTPVQETNPPPPSSSNGLLR